MNNLLRYTALSLAATTIVSAGGYKIPETSINAVALSAANVAHSTSADAAYYNPANMVFMEDKQNFEANLMYIGLEPTRYKSHDGSVDIESKSESFAIPSLFYVSKKLGDKSARVGVSVVVPGGLTKRWSDSPAVDRAEEFSLQVVEVNPTAAFHVTDELAVAFGFRIVSSSGVVKSTSSASRELTGDSIDFGYNVAIAYRPTQDIEVGITYRSNVDLSVEGNAKLDIGNARIYDGGASVAVPLPATLSAAIAYTLPTKTTLEFVYERAYWSAYSSLDFNYVSPIPTILQPSFDNPIAKDWEDVNAYRLGITQEMDALTLMAGAVYGETPVPENSVSFELPDSDSLSVSFGARYALSDSLDFGLSALYSMREDRDVTNDDIDGEFSNSNVLLVSAGVGYKF